MDFALKLKSTSRRQDKDGGSLPPMGPWRWLQGVTLTEVQELFDREWRWGEAGVAFDLLGDRLLEQPVEESHPHPCAVPSLPRLEQRPPPPSHKEEEAPAGLYLHLGLGLGASSQSPPRNLHKHRAAVRRPWSAARGFSSPA